MRRRDP